MNKSGFCLGVALIMIALGAVAKEATPNDVNKSYVDSGKREQRFPAVENVNQTERWQPYLGWHRDASSLQGSNNRSGSTGGSVPDRQL
jgi:hypothetical protein